MTSRLDNPFDRFPRLPVVPVPWPGEALSGWIEAAIAPYGLSTPDFLAHLGLRCSGLRANFYSHVLLEPGERLLRALNEATGVSISRLRGMTLEKVERDLSEACFLHYSPCATCEREAAVGAGRPVKLLDAWFPWRVVCPKHPPPALTEEVAHINNKFEIIGRLSDITRELDEIAQHPLQPHEIQGKTPFTLSPFVRFVYLLNAFIFVRLEWYDELWNRATFRIIRTFDRDKRDRPVELTPETRNHIGISLLLAWQLTLREAISIPICLRTMHEAGFKTDQDSAQMNALLYIAKEFWGSKEPIAIFKSSKPHHVTASFRNRPDYKKLIAEVEWNYKTIVCALFSPQVLRFSRPGVSEFPTVGPFRHRYVPAQLNSSTYTQYRRDLARGKRKSRVGFEAWLAQSSQRSDEKRSEEQEFRRSVYEKSLDDRIRPAVNQAIKAFGPIPNVTSLKDRRRILCQLQRLASRILVDDQRLLTGPAAF